MNMDIGALSFTVGIIGNDKFTSEGKPTAVNNGVHMKTKDVCTT